MSRRKIVAITISLMLVVAAQASATVMVFTNQASFDAALVPGSETTTSFSGLQAAGTWSDLGTSYVSGPLTLTGDDNGTVAAYNDAAWFVGSGLQGIAAHSGSYLNGNVSGSYSAIALRLQLPSGGEGEFSTIGTLHLSDGTNVPYTAGPAAAGTELFMGFVVPSNAAAHITGWTGDPGNLTSNGWAGIGGFSVGQSNVVPEPSTITLLMAGLLGLLCYALRKRK